MELAVGLKMLGGEQGRQFVRLRQMGAIDLHTPRILLKEEVREAQMEGKRAEK